MRTSRVSRETAQIVNALSSERRRSTRQSLQAFADDRAGAEGQEVEEKVAPDAVIRQDDDDSSSLSSLGSLGKRKREDDTSTPRKAAVLEATTVRRAPRKALKTEDAEYNQDNTAFPRKPRRQPAQHIKGPNGAVTVEPPPNWAEVYNITAAMRKRIIAPVDTMGCESLAEEHRSPRDQRLQTLVSLMLSSQTKDTVTAAAMKNLQENMPGGFTLESLIAVEPAVLNELIGKVGFHNNKTKYLKATATILRYKHNDDIPSTIEGLVSLPGVGPKMAYLCMSAAWGRTEGIGVDVHVHRITNLWGWHKTATPEQTRAELEAWLPREKWHEINHLLVGLGQTVCLPVGRRCGDCDLAEKGLCPGAEVRKGSPRKKVKRELEVKVEDGEVATKSEEVKVEADDVAVKVEAESGDLGHVEVQAAAGATADIEDAVK
ncbi:alpha,alpha-trehalase nth1 [Saxophila tyrrhenica]|uniref:Endonuclease III homolog n=1 Tax=Saxophila tyrrhenica TaxID=1690608 RepID=A0AAV9PED1_9PEZI|nr:alpha,alpha-trehalase nth1 [Saxophila tyrrhenica]